MCFIPSRGFISLFNSSSLSAPLDNQQFRRLNCYSSPSPRISRSDLLRVQPQQCFLNGKTLKSPTRLLMRRKSHSNAKHGQNDDSLDELQLASDCCEYGKAFPSFGGFEQKFCTRHGVFANRETGQLSNGINCSLLIPKG